MVRIQHNITSLNVHRNLTGNNRSVARDLEKLSSGYKINRAGDDAAGLAISEKMRAQITGLEQAWQNADDGISLVQTAEGAMTEVHTMLNRMMELSVQSANGTYTEKERIMMNQEVQKLKTEITRVGSTTSFNSIHLFPDGSIFSTKEASVTTYNLTLDLKNGTVQIDRSGAASASGAGGVSRAANNLADKIAEEYFPNAVRQILDKFPSLKTALAGDTVGMELQIGNIDGSGGMLAYAKFSFRATGKAGNMLIMLDSSDFSDASITGAAEKTLESTLAHEIMHSVMQYTMTDQMSGRGGSERFPEWFTEGTAQLAGGGFPTHWNDTLINIANTLTNANDTSKDTEIANYLRSYSVAGRPYGHGYLASAYIGYLAGGAGAVDGTTIANGMNRVFQEITQNKASLFGAISTATGGKITSQGGLESLFSSGNSDLVAFVRQLAFNSKNGSGSVIANSLGDTDIIGATVTGDQEFYLTDNPTKPTGKGIASTRGIQLMVGCDNESASIINVELFRMNTDSLGLTLTNVLDQDSSREAIEQVNNAIDELSSIRSYYGALQNRLEHTVSNLSNTIENLTAAESRIRDTDMAKSMMSYVRNSILVQSSQAMLAQANQQPSSVLQLLSA